MAEFMSVGDQTFHWHTSNAALWIGSRSSAAVSFTTRAIPFVKNGTSLSTAIGPDPKVNTRVMNLAKVFLKHRSPRLEDLVEIAS